MDEGNHSPGREHRAGERPDILLRIERLNSLVDGGKASLELIGFGPAAIGPLRDFLLLGAPSSIFQPRQLAVEALAALRAKDVLIEYLNRDEGVTDPVLRQGEDAVLNTAARLLANWNSEDVFQLLLKLAQKRILSGVIEALGHFSREEALPVFDNALEDDVAGPVAEQALVQFGSRAVDALIASVGRKRMDEENELPSSLRRRRAAAEILSASMIERNAWPKLQFLLDECDAELVIHAAHIAVAIGGNSDKMNAVAALLRALPDAPWHVHDEAMLSLESLYDVGEDLIVAEIARRNAMAAAHHRDDAALLTLLRLRSKVKRGVQHPAES